MGAPYVPARDPRHRTACFALYRALLRLGPRVPLPDSLVQGPGPVHPIKHLIRKGFHRNRTDVSPRIVVSALSNGYKFLDLLSAAGTADSPEHVTVLDFLTRQNDRFKRKAFASERESIPSSPESASASASASAPTPAVEQSSPKPKSGKLLERIPNPKFDPGDIRDEPKFFYTVPSRPTPQSSLGGTGIRRVPTLVATSDGFPFLRFRKPQPTTLGTALKRMQLKRANRTGRLIDMGQDDMWEALEEDKWEKLLVHHAGLKPEDGAGGDGKRGNGGRGARFAHSVNEGIMALANTLSLERMDQAERGKALWKVVKAERELAQSEKAAWLEAEEKRKAVWLEAEEKSKMEASKPKNDERSASKSKSRLRPADATKKVTGSMSQWDKLQQTAAEARASAGRKKKTVAGGEAEWPLFVAESSSADGIAEWLSAKGIAEPSSANGSAKSPLVDGIAGSSSANGIAESSSTDDIAESSLADGSKATSKIITLVQTMTATTTTMTEAASNTLTAPKTTTSGTSQASYMRVPPAETSPAKEAEGDQAKTKCNDGNVQLRRVLTVDKRPIFTEKTLAGGDGWDSMFKAIKVEIQPSQEDTQEDLAKLQARREKAIQVLVGDGWEKIVREVAIAAAVAHAGPSAEKTGLGSQVKPLVEKKQEGKGDQEQRGDGAATVMKSRWAKATPRRGEEDHRALLSKEEEEEESHLQQKKMVKGWKGREWDMVKTAMKTPAQKRALADLGGGAWSALEKAIERRLAQEEEKGEGEGEGGVATEKEEDASSALASAPPLSSYNRDRGLFW